MKAVAVLSALACTALVAAQSQCVIDCSTQAADAAGCVSYLNVSCICTSATFQNTAGACLSANCSAADQSQALGLQQTICAGQSVTSGSVTDTLSATTDTGAAASITASASGSGSAASASASMSMSMTGSMSMSASASGASASVGSATSAASSKAASASAAATSSAASAAGARAEVGGVKALAGTALVVMGMVAGGALLL